VVFFVFLCALGGFVVNGAQKPGAVLDFVWMSVAYFLASGAISEARELRIVLGGLRPRQRRWVPTAVPHWLTYACRLRKYS